MKTWDLGDWLVAVGATLVGAAVGGTVIVVLFAILRSVLGEAYAGILLAMFLVGLVFVAVGSFYEQRRRQQELADERRNLWS